MSKLITSLRDHMTLLDAVLLVAGMIGFAGFLVLLPAQHPESAAVSSLDQEEVQRRAESYISENGFVISGDLEPETAMRRNSRILDDLQKEFGRREAVRLLRETRGRLPAFSWRVGWSKARGESPALGVSLTLDGGIYSFRTDPGQTPARRVDRGALRYLMASEQPEPVESAPEQPRPVQNGASQTVPPASSAVRTLPADSLLEARLAFDLPAPTARPDTSLSGTGVLTDTASSLDARLQTEEQAWLNARAAAVLARYHLARTAFEGAAFSVDSVRSAARPGMQAASVYLNRSEPLYGQNVGLTVEVAATGALLSLEPEFRAVGAPARRSEAVEADTVFDMVKIIVIVALMLGMLVVFGRRTSARLVDMKSAVRDAFWGAFFLVAQVLVMAGWSIAESVPQVWLAVLLISVLIITVGAFGFFAFVVASGAMDSVARSVWEEKVTTLSLVRYGAFRNVPVGAALMRGLLIAFALLGLVSLLLALFPAARIIFSSAGSDVMPSFMLSQAAYAFSKHAWVSQLIALTVMLGVGSLLMTLRSNALLVAGGVAAVLLLLQVLPFLVEPISIYLLFCGAVAVVLAWVFWRFEFVTAMTAMLFFGALWETKSGWIAAEAPAFVDAVAGFIVVGAAVTVALVGLLSGRSASEVPALAPEYIKELARDERMKRDLEIAHQVQASFLPRKMPNVEGLEIAAMCLPAMEVGGDYFDFIEIDRRRLGVVIGDVSGKGIQAAFYMTLVKGFLQTLSRIVPEPAEVLRQMNVLFCMNVPRGTFVSMVYGVVDMETRTFTFARAGHNPVIVRRSASRESVAYRPRGMAIGLTSGGPFDESIEQEVVHLRAGDVLVFYTDGFSEAMNARKELYGDGRLALRVAEVGQRGANEILRFVAEDVHHFLEAKGRQDDMTMVVLKLDGRQSAPVDKSVHREQVN